ncbi:MAG: hypothetical protein AAF151_23815, partial [Cyanobacteria bacterium J06656_5]
TCRTCVIFSELSCPSKLSKLWGPLQWDRSGRELQTLEGHSGRGLSVSFSPDGQTLATTSDDGTVKLWDRSGRELQTLEGHSGTVWSVSFSPDGQTLVSGSGEFFADGSYGGTGIVWNLDLDDLMVKSCDWLRDYMNSPATPPEEKALCDNVLSPSSLSTVPTQSSLVSQLQSVWSDVQAWLRG